MMEAYFDESGTQGGAAALCVAGYLLEVERCQVFDRELAERLGAIGVKVFHAADRAARQGEFAGKSRQECNVLLIDMVALIKKHASFGVVAAVSEAEFARLGPVGWHQAGGEPYTFCAQICMAAVGRWVRENAPTEKVVYFFEKGHKDESETNTYLKRVKNDPVLTQEYCY